MQLLGTMKNVARLLIFRTRWFALGKVDHLQMSLNALTDENKVSGFRLTVTQRLPGLCIKERLNLDRAKQSSSLFD